MKALKTSTLLLLLSLVSHLLKAQSADTIVYTDVAAFKDSVFLPNSLVFIDSSNNLSPQQALSKKWLPLTGFNIKSNIPEAWITKRIFIRLDITNAASTADSIYFFPGISFRSIKTFRITNNGLQPIADQSQAEGYQPLEIAPTTKQSYVIELHFTKTVFNYLIPQLIKKNYLAKFKKMSYHKNAPLQAVSFLFSGVLLMMIIFSLANFSLSRKKEFALYGLYVSCMFLLFFFSTYFEKSAGVTSSLFSSYLAFALLATGTIFYIAFTRKFLNTRVNFPLLNKLFMYEEGLILLALLLFTFLNFFTQNFQLQHLLENGMKITALAIGIVYIVVAIKQKNRLINYLAIGNVMLIIFAMASFYLILFIKPQGSIFFSPLFYYELGIVCELMLFLMGLTYKNRIELIEKIQEQEALKLAAEKQLFEAKLAVLNARQKERNRISADMHDDLGAGITAIRLYSELAKNKPDKDSMPEIEKISFSANELLNNMNAIIWAMNNSNDSLENMIAYIRSYAQEYFENTGIKCTINIMEGLPDIAVWGEIRKNVFLVIKETLNNVLKHAQATEVTITLTKVPDGMALYIHDNGIGIDFDKIRRFANGLKNMKKRMEEMHIGFSIENKNGTLVTLHYAIRL